MSNEELRRLLELAAKAEGHGVEFDEVSGLVWYENKYTGLLWDPENNDGDSRRLEVVLLFWKKDFSPIEGELAHGMIEIWREGEDAPIHVEWYKPEDDRLAATRLAVLRAAAAIGEAMP